MGDINVQETLESEAVGDLGVVKVIVGENFCQALTQRLEHALRDMDTEFVFEVLEHLWTIECLCL